MKRMIAVTAVGLDRPGIVAGFTQTLFNNGCNLEESSMTLLHRDFAMIILISLPDSLSIEHISQEIKKTSDQFNLSFSLRELSSDEISNTKSDSEANYSLSIYGIDKAGIVYSFTNLLAQKSINIIDLETQITHTEKQPLYSIVMDIFIPDSVDLDSFNKEIKTKSEEMTVDFSLTQIMQCEEM